MGDYHAEFFFKRRRATLTWTVGNKTFSDYDRPCYPCSDCQYTQGTHRWKSEVVCFDCRISRRFPLGNRDKPDCPGCGKTMRRLSARLRVPRRHQVKHWRRLRVALDSAIQRKRDVPRTP